MEFIWIFSEGLRSPRACLISTVVCDLICFCTSTCLCMALAQYHTENQMLRSFAKLRNYFSGCRKLRRSSYWESNLFRRSFSTLDRISGTFQAFTCFYPEVFHLKKLYKLFLVRWLNNRFNGIHCYLATV